jgi:hypothetical protein
MVRVLQLFSEAQLLQALEIGIANRWAPAIFDDMGPAAKCRQAMPASQIITFCNSIRRAKLRLEIVGGRKIDSRSFNGSKQRRQSIVREFFLSF